MTVALIGTVRVQALLHLSVKISAIMLQRVDQLTVEDIDIALKSNEMLGLALRRVAGEVKEMEGS